MSIVDIPEDDELRPWVLTRPCKADWCGNGVGGLAYLRRKSGQDTVWCRGTDDRDPLHYCGWNATRLETGSPTETLRTRPGIAPSKRSRILKRDNYRCLMCGATAQDARLDIGHLISRDAGSIAGLTDLQLEDDENLGTLCGPCNSGQGRNPVTLQFAIRILRVRLERKNRTKSDDGPDSLFDQ